VNKRARLTLNGLFEVRVQTVEPGETFHCPKCGLRIDEDDRGRFIGKTGKQYRVTCPSCKKKWVVELDTETTAAYRAKEDVSGDS
jgi:predicted RNA-binding Zn-ribbon protein involved in translation (DUF1610 family)